MTQCLWRPMSMILIIGCLLPSILCDGKAKIKGTHFPSLCAFSCEWFCHLELKAYDTLIFSFPLFLPFLSEAHRIDILTSLFPEIFGESKFHDAIYVLPLIPTQPAYSLTHLLSPTCTCHGKEQVTRHLTYKPRLTPHARTRCSMNMHSNV